MRYYLLLFGFELCGATAVGNNGSSNAPGQTASPVNGVQGGIAV